MSSFRIRLVAVALPLAVAFGTVRASEDSAGRDQRIRAVWVTRWDFRSREDVIGIVRNSHALGFGRIYFQVRGRADAFYRSKLEPWGEELGGRDPGFDPLETATNEAHRLGVELHAWVNVLAGWKGKTPPEDRRHAVHAHPDWFLLDRWGKLHLYDDHYTIVNPCRAEVRKHIVEVIGDIARRYPVDGIQLDYIRFIAEGEKERQGVPYDNLTLRDFRRENDGDFPVRRPEAWDAFRRRAVDRLVEEISKRVREVRPRCILSASVLRDFDRARARFFQDARTWVEKGWIAEVVPMNYERELGEFERHLADIVRSCGRDRVICGVGGYLARSANDVAAQIAAAERRRIRGWALFAYADLFPSRSHESHAGAEADQRRRAMREAIARLTATRDPVATRPSTPLRSAPRRAAGASK